MNRRWCRTLWTLAGRIQRGVFPGLRFLFNVAFESGAVKGCLWLADVALPSGETLLRVGDPGCGSYRFRAFGEALARLILSVTGVLEGPGEPV